MNSKETLSSRNIPDLLKLKTGRRVKTASKEPETRIEFNCFTFYYKGMDYTLKDGELQMTLEID